MNSGIYYLYEYNRSQRLRNVGFLKLSANSRTIRLQLQARGIPVARQDTAVLAAFYLKNETAVFYVTAQLPCISRSISTQLEIPEDSLPDAYRSGQIQGFLLMLPGDTYLAATVPGAALDVQNIHEYPKTQKDIKSASETAAVEGPSVPAAAAAEDSLAPESSVPGTTAMGEPLTQESSVIKESSISGTTAAEEFSDPGTTMEEKPSVSGITATEESSISETSAAEESCAPADDSADSSESGHRVLRKIQPGELSILPRRHWNLANNSFLLHGCRNYNHLLLIEENGHCWIGVPGIYDPREARAAELFGFPQFSDSFNDRLSLTDDECSPFGKFGYWCRSIY